MSNASKNITQIARHRPEIERSIRNKRFEVSAHGVLLPQQGLFLHGGFESRVRRGGRFGHAAFDPNKIPTAALNFIIDAIIAAGPWYVAGFTQNSTPGDSLTAANFNSSLTEWTGYDESTRQLWDAAAASGGASSNDAARAEFTANASATVYGAALLSVSTKSSGSGTLLCASKFAAGRAVVDDDTLEIKYTLSGTG